MWPILVPLIFATIPIAVWLFKIPLPENWFIKVIDFLQWTINYPFGLAPFDEILLSLLSFWLLDSFQLYYLYLLFAFIPWFCPCCLEQLF